MERTPSSGCDNSVRHAEAAGQAAEVGQGERQAGAYVLGRAVRLEGGMALARLRVRRWARSVAGMVRQARRWACLADQP